MKLLFKRPDNYDKRPNCAKCSKDIDVSEGFFFHCPNSECTAEDYHQNCLQEARKTSWNKSEARIIVLNQQYKQIYLQFRQSVQILLSMNDQNA
jgi:hypothetical protein